MGETEHDQVTREWERRLRRAAAAQVQDTELNPRVEQAGREALLAKADELARELGGAQ